MVSQHSICICTEKSFLFKASEIAGDIVPGELLRIDGPGVGVGVQLGERPETNIMML
jgi:hypothetical protein